VYKARFRYSSVIFFVATFLITSSIFSEEPKTNPTIEKGIGQYKHENFDEAIITLKKAREEEPQSTLAAYYLGLSYKQTQNYKEAICHLQDAVTVTPKIKGALIELVDCLYQLNRTDEAKKWIAEAEAEGIRPAQVSFLKGLVLTKNNEDDGAIAAFENAKALDNSLAQSCDYQIGIIHVKEKRFEEAKDVFREVITLGPNSSMASFANEYMDAIARRQEQAKPLRITAGFAWQYDDNVVLKPDDASAAANISDKADSREVTTARVEYDKRLTELLGIKGMYSYYWSKQNDLGFYDTVSNSFIGQPTAYFKQSVLSFPSGWTHTIVNDKAYLSNPSTSAVYNYMVNGTNMAQGFVKYQYKDYLWAPSLPSENRDGSDLSASAGWYLFYAKQKGFINARYAFNKEWTKGANWEYAGNRATVTALIPVIDKLNVTLSGDIYVQNFEHTNSVYQIKRDDTVYTVSALVAYKIYKDLAELQVQYTHIKDDSNISVYDYSRNIYSLGVEIKF